ncbi:hypothetical protein BH09SUM1_BH09SUM1_28050 [soil metagenome]
MKRMKFHAAAGGGRSVSPGQILRREIEARGWTNRDLAKAIDRSEESIQDIVEGREIITSDLAASLGRALETGPEFWTNLEHSYRPRASKSAGGPIVTTPKVVRENPEAKHAAAWMSAIARSKSKREVRAPEAVKPSASAVPKKRAAKAGAAK